MSNNNSDVDTDDDVVGNSLNPPLTMKDGVLIPLSTKTNSSDEKPSTTKTTHKYAPEDPTAKRAVANILSGLDRNQCPKLTTLNNKEWPSFLEKYKHYKQTNGLTSMIACFSPKVFSSIELCFTEDFSTQADEDEMIRLLNSKFGRFTTESVAQIEAHLHTFKMDSSIIMTRDLLTEHLSSLNHFYKENKELIDEHISLDYLIMKVLVSGLTESFTFKNVVEIYLKKHRQPDFISALRVTFHQAEIIFDAADRVAYPLGKSNHQTIHNTQAHVTTTSSTSELPEPKRDKNGNFFCHRCNRNKEHPTLECPHMPQDIREAIYRTSVINYKNSNKARYYKKQTKTEPITSSTSKSTTSSNTTAHATIIHSSTLTPEDPPEDVSSDDKDTTIATDTTNTSDIPIFNVTCANTRVSSPRITIGFDTMCSEHITPHRGMIGEIFTDRTFNISGFVGNSSTSSMYGFNPVFGLMIYAPNAVTTLLSFGRLHKDKFILPNFNLPPPWSLQAPAPSNTTIHLELNTDNVVVLNPSDVESIMNQSSTGVMVYHTTIPQMNHADYSRGCEVIRCHHVLCHPGTTELIHSINTSCFQNIPFNARDITNADVIRGGACNACAMGKITKSVHHPSHNPTSSPIKDIITPPSPARYEPLHGNSGDTLGLDLFYIDKEAFLIAVTKHTRMVHSVHLSNRGLDAVSAAIRHVLTDYKSTHYTIKHLYNADLDNKYNNSTSLPTSKISNSISDGEKSIIAAGITDLPLHGIHLDVVPSGEHVCFVERTIRTLKERINATRSCIEYLLPVKILLHLVIYCTDMLNLLCRTGQVKSSWYQHRGTIPRYRDVVICEFGQPVVSHRPVVNLGVNQYHGESGIMVGLSLSNPGAINFFSYNTQQVKTRQKYALATNVDTIQLFGKNPQAVPPVILRKSLSAFANDAIHPYADRTPTDPSPLLPIHPDVPLHASTTPMVSITDSNINPNTFSLVDDLNPPVITVNDDEPIASPNSDGILYNSGTNMSIQADDSEQNNDSTVIPPLPVVRTSIPRAAKAYNYQNVFNSQQWSCLTQAKEVINTQCNMTWLRGEVEFEKEEVDAAVFNELNQLVNEHGVFEPVSINPYTVPYLPSHDLITRKMDGVLKARFVVGKEPDNSNIDYGIDLYSPTIDSKLIYLILSYCLQNNSNFTVWDVKGAFLKAPMVVDNVHVLIRKEIADRIIKLRPEWQSYLHINGSLLVKVKKAWYGTTSGPALWNREIHHTLVHSCGYIQHSMVPCLYYRILTANQTSIIMLHVDDLGGVFPSDNIERDRVKGILEEKYDKLKIQVGDNVTYIGLEIERDRKQNTFIINMKQRIKKLLDQYKITTPAKNPCINTPSLMVHDPNSPEVPPTAYRSIVMSARYIAAFVKPETLFHTSYLASYQCSPTLQYMAAAMHLLKYYLHTIDQSIHIGALGADPVIQAYTDASHNTHNNSHAHICKAIFIGNAGGAIHVASNKLRCCTASSADSEVCSINETYNLAEYFRDVLIELKLTCRIHYYNDNDPAIILIKSGTFHHDKKSKFMVNRINILNEYFHNTKAYTTLHHIATKDNIADIGTKPLHSQLFMKHRASIIGYTYAD